MINNVKDLLIVKDNFFSEDIYKKILTELSTLNFSNRNVTSDIKDKNIYQRIIILLCKRYINFWVIMDLF
jgi:hypothetical protein